MAEHNVDINWPDGVTEREFYECLVGPLFEEESMGIRIPGMMHGFIFEEFYPDRFPYDDSEWVPPPQE